MRPSAVLFITLLAGLAGIGVYTLLVTTSTIGGICSAVDTEDLPAKHK